MKTLTKGELKAEILALEKYISDRNLNKGTEDELRKRAESYKAQLIVYKGIVQELLDKLIEGNK